MKKLIIVAAVAICTAISSFGQYYNDPDLNKLYQTYVTVKDSVRIPVLNGTTITDKTFDNIEFPGCESYMTGYVTTPKKYKAFDLKKDNINNIRIVKVKLNNGVECYNLYVVHRNGQACDMNEFSVRLNGNNLKCVQIEGYDSYSLGCSVFDLADGTCSCDGSITVTHKASGQNVTIPYRFTWCKSLHKYGSACSFMVTPVKSNLDEPVYSVIDLADGTMFVLKGNLTLDVSGRDGANGYNGANGINGTDYREYTDKNGKKHVIRASFGTPGQNGGNGGNGENGGHLLVLRDKSVPYNAITMKYKGGKGGKGGSGGIGGRHGNGSGLKGRAADGRDGRDGLDGSYGSASNLAVSTVDYFEQLMKTCSITTYKPLILVDVTEKTYRGNAKKKSEQDKNDAAIDAVEF